MSKRKAAPLFIAAFAALALLFAGIPVGALALGDGNQEPTLVVENRDSIPEKALIGTAVTLPEATASDPVDGALEYTVRVSLGSRDITEAGKKTYTLSEAGVYTLYYETVNSAGFYAFDSIAIDVRKLWLTTCLTGENLETALVGQTVTLAGAVAKDFSGAEISGLSVNVTVQRGSSEVAVQDNSFVAAEAGVYTVTYSAEKDGEQADEIVNVITVTGSRPILTVKNMPATGEVGKEMTIPKASARDDNGKAVTVTLKISNGDTELSYTETDAGYTFTPESEGDYTVVFTATNSEGVQNSAKHTVHVEKGARGGCGCGTVGFGATAGFFGGAALTALTAAGVLCMALCLKKRRSNI